MRKPKIDLQSVIYCGNEEDAYLAYMAMFRYTFGRMTYMPGVVIGIIKRNKENIPDRALMLINTELAEEADRYERLYKEHHERGAKKELAEAIKCGLYISYEGDDFSRKEDQQ